MNGLPYYKAYPRDFFEGTIGMDFEVKAAYRLLLDLIYMHGGRMADDPRFIAGHLGCSVKRWNVLRRAILGTGKVTVSDGYLGNYRADKELDSLKSFQDKQREKAAKPRKNKDLALAAAEPKPSHTEPDTDKKEREAKASPKKASRLRPDWRIPDEWVDWSTSQGMTCDQAASQADRFRDYWTAKAGKDGAKMDWEATWRNWCRKFMDDNRRGNQNGTRKPSRADEDRAILEAAKRLPDDFFRDQGGNPWGSA